jgi:hypothetical protein
MSAEPVPWGWHPYGAKRPCEWGQCGNCERGKHQACQFVKWPSRTGRRAPHTWVLNTEGGVISPHFPVYVTGADHDWVCSCHAAGHAPVAGQLDLLAGIA